MVVWLMSTLETLMTLEMLVTPNRGSSSSTNQPSSSQCMNHGVSPVPDTTIPAVVPEDNVRSHLRLHILHQAATGQDRLLNTAAVAPDTGVTTTGTTTTPQVVTTTENPLTGLIRVVIMRATNEAGDEDLRIIIMTAVVTEVVVEATKDRDLTSTTATTRKTSS